VSSSSQNSASTDNNFTKKDANMMPINCIPIDQYYHKKVRNQENSLKISNFIVSDSQQNKSNDPNINLNNK